MLNKLTHIVLKYLINMCKAQLFVLFQELRRCNKRSILFYACFLQYLNLNLLARMFSSHTSKATKEAYSCLFMSIFFKDIIVVFPMQMYQIYCKDHMNLIISFLPAFS